MIKFESLMKTEGTHFEDDFKDVSKVWKDIVTDHVVIEDKAAAPLYSAVIPKDKDQPLRGKDYIKGASAVIIDFDNEEGDEPTSYRDVSDKLADYEHYIHSTHSNMVNKKGYIRERFRLILPLSRAVSLEEWPHAWGGLYDLLEQDKNIDKSCNQISRAYFVRSSTPENEQKSFHIVNDCEKVEPEFLFSNEKVKVKSERLLKSSDKNTDFEEVKEAIWYIENMERFNWLQVCMALKHEFGENSIEALDLFHEWSAKDYPGYDQKECEDTWNSLKRNSGSIVSINTFYQLAIDGGWTRQTAVVDTDYLNAILEHAKKKTGKEEKKYINYTAPGIVGEIADWITLNAFKPQPALSLGTAITAVGVIMGGKYRTHTDLRSNFLNLMISDSGTGKNHPQNAISKLFNDSGLNNLIGPGGATSGTALLRVLQDGKGSALMNMDEIGRTLKGLNGKNAAGHEQELLTNIMQLFSSANTIYRGKKFAQQDGVTLKQPCLCMNGYTTPGRFYESISSDEALDGFLSRWLVFEGNPEPTINKKAGIYDVPKSLVDRIQLLHSHDVAKGIKTVEMTPEAFKVWDNFGDYCEEQRIKERRAQTGFDALWTRGSEHAAKLALVLHDFEHEGTITEEVMQWAVKFISDMINNNILKLSDNLADNSDQRAVKKMLRVIKNFNRPVTKTELSSATSDIADTRKRNNILQELEDTGKIKVIKEVIEGSKRPVLKYFSV